MTEGIPNGNWSVKNTIHQLASQHI